MDDMSRIILIGNTTFTFTEENLKEKSTETRNCLDNQWTSKKDNYTPFKTITISSVEQNRQDEDCHKQLEPCMFDTNFCQFGYFTQNYSNLTVYLNEESLLTNQINQNQKLPNCISLNPNTPNQQQIINPEPPPKQTPKILIKPNEEVPAFIDLDKINQNPLVISDGRKKSLVVPPFLKRNRKTKKKTEDDDVIFVKEYKKTNGDEEKVFPEPRRNPKRKVQLQKMSYELAEKISMDEYDEECRLVNMKSSKMPGAVFSPPSILSTEDFKDWPAEGMHEKPNYNPLTQKLEKISVPKKLKLNLQRITTLNKKKIPVRRKTRKQLDVEANKEFATLTHHTFHLVLSFVEQIKTYNKLVKKSTDDLSLNVLDSELDQLRDVEKLLTYSSVLYSIANNVSSTSLVSYIEVLKKNGTVDV